MALAQMGPFEIQASPTSTILVDDPGVSYDAYADELILRLDRTRDQSFSLPVNDFGSLLCDEDTDEIIGIQIDHFATYAMQEHPELRIIGKVIGIQPRDPADNDLFNEDRVVLRSNDFTPEEKARFKEVISRIIDYTGGFDPDISSQANVG